MTRFFSVLLVAMALTGAALAQAPQTPFRAIEDAPVNVRDWGAIPDDGLDDTTAIRSAISAAAARGTYVFYPPGEWNLTGPIKYSAPMEGADPNRVIIKALPEFRSEVSETYADTDVDTANDNITLTGHGFVTGDAAVATFGGGTPITTSPIVVMEGNTVWPIVVDANTIQIAASEADALATPPVPLDITAAGSGSGFGFETKLMMLDHYDGTLVETNRRFIRNVIFDVNNQPGLRAWGSTSLGGSGPSGGGRSVYENIQLRNGHHEKYCLDAKKSDIAVGTEPGYLTGSTFINFSTQRCELVMYLGTDIDDLTFITPRTNVDGNNQNLATQTPIVLETQNTTFIDWFVGSVDNLGNAVTGGRLDPARYVIELGPRVNNVDINGLFIESNGFGIGGPINVTHIFGAKSPGFTLNLSKLVINVDSDGSARALVYARLAAGGTNRSNFNVRNVVAGGGPGNPFLNVVETDRVAAALTAEQAGVNVYFDALEAGFFRPFPFSLLNGTGSNNQHEDYLRVFGSYEGRRYDHGVIEGSLYPRRGRRVDVENFDGATDVDPLLDEITFTNHSFQTGDPLFYEALGGTPPTGMADFTEYFAVDKGKDHISLATSQVNAFAGILVDITADGVGAGQSISRMAQLTLRHNNVAGRYLFTAPTSGNGTDTVTVKLPGNGVYFVTIQVRRGGTVGNMASSTYIVHYNTESSQLTGFDRIGTAKIAGSMTDVVIASGPTRDGALTLTATWGGGTFDNLWIVTAIRRDWSN